MITDTSTLPRRALTEGADLAASTPQAPIATRPRRKKRGPWRLPHVAPSAGSRRPVSEYLMLVGPGGGTVWTSRRP